ncbi:NAD(P)/FAD-dependent oxidoreductase [Falsiroseomonas sp. CW058]|uniref:NAD(P)/FAD-dependent oxidoreductase n=1 Tax=Falsiroseomonas sp. CW058 TaxID=3388664 RepID=UPI003D313F5C
MPNDAFDHDVLVMGAGIAGLAAATACAAAGLRTAVAGTGLFGGLVLNVNDLVEPPRPDQASGADYAATLFGEAMEAGAEPIDGPVATLWRDGAGFAARPEEEPGRVLRARAVICATGASPRPLPVPGAGAFAHRGIAHCADCDGPLHRGRPVVVVGGGDAALQGALTLAAWASEVHVLLRGAAPRARAEFVARAAAEPRIRLHRNAEILRLLGEDGLEAVEVREGAGAPLRIAARAVFPWIGLMPNTAALPAEVTRDADGAVVVDAALRTSLPGLFAAGAVRAGHGGRLRHALHDGEGAARGVIAMLTTGAAA